MLADKTLGRYIPTSLISFGAVGSLGVAVHLMTLYACLLLLQLSFTQSQTAAVFIAMVFNFQLNNLLTYRDKQLMGWLWWWGLTKFMAACSLGALANVGVASWLHGGGAAFTPEHHMNSPIPVMNASLCNLFHSHDQSRVVARIGFVQIHNPAELDHSASLTHTGSKPLHQVCCQFALA